MSSVAALDSEPLAALKAAGLYRQTQTLEQRQGHRARLDGRELRLFCSNDYLGLSQHPEVVAEFIAGAQQWGAGAGAAHLISGHNRPHAELEERIADFMGYEAALLFSTGYMANLGIISALCGRHDTVVQDRLNHASLIDGCKLAGATLKRYAHGDAAAAKQRLPARLLASDGVFSMDGDIAPIAELAQETQQNQSLLFIDDAHGFGVVGPQGRGSVAACGLGAKEVPLQLLTLGKAAGTFGAALVGSREHIELCINRARPYIYTTALPAANACAAATALTIIQQGDGLREKLQANIQQFQQGAEQLGLNLMPSATAIQPLVLPGNENVLAASKKLLELGFLVTAVRSPTVPKGQERLRITLSADHNPQDITELLNALSTL